MTPPRKISAHFEIVTPMFLGDANQKATRISEASIKGALVFWWRALNYAVFVKEAAGDQAKALAALYEREVFLFGGGGSGQSRVLLKVRTQTISGSAAPESLLPGVKDGDGIAYLGYGLMDYKGKLTRSCFNGGNFSIDLIIRQGALTDDDIGKSILPAIKLFGLIGGLGSRVRRGWGSVALSELSVDGEASWVQPDSLGAYELALKDILGERFRSVSGKTFPITAFAHETDIRCGSQLGTTPLACMSNVSKGLQRYRSWGQTGDDGIAKVNGQPSEMNFRADHDWFKDKNRSMTGKFADTAGNTHSTDALPKRAAFGLPHNYFSRGFGKMDVSAAKTDRRASPLMFHVHKLATGQCFTVASFFPTKFLADGKITAGGRSKTFEFDSATILSFLDNKRPNGTNPPNGPYFPNTKVFP